MNTKESGLRAGGLNSPATAISAAAAALQGAATRPTSPAASGAARTHFEARIVRVALEIPSDERWRELRRLAYQCAAFANTLLTESYAKAKNQRLKFTTYTDFAEVLSAGIRDAVARECVGLWRRLGKKILRGEQTLARFSADRALVVRDRAVRLVREHDRMVARLRLHPKSEGEATELPLYMNALREARYRSLLERLAAGEWRISKATLMFERPGRKVFLLLSYDKPLEAAASGDAHIAWLGIDDEQLFLRDAEGHRLALTDHMHRLSQRKNDFAGIHRRLRQALGRRRGRGHRQELRAALLKAGCYENWAQGPLHQLSHEVVEWCRAHQVTTLQWELPDDGLLPWARLRLLCEYKGRERGLAISQMKPATPHTGSLRKSRRGKGKESVAAEAVGERPQADKR